MAQITSPVPQINVEVASQEAAASNLFTEIKSLLNGALELDNLTVALRSLADVPLVTSLPGSPVDKQLIRYLADSAAGIVWTFRYREASASPFKWEFVGGAAIVGVDNNSYPVSGDASSRAGIYAPLAGEYTATASGTVAADASSDVLLLLGTTAAPTDLNNRFARAFSGITTSGGRTVRVSLALGNYVAVKPFVVTGSGTVGYMSTAMVPVRVG